jgi:hypothetical protein
MDLQSCTPKKHRFFAGVRGESTVVENPSMVQHPDHPDADCVEFGARSGAVFEARTYRRGDAGVLAGIDLEGLWSGAAHDEYVEPAPSDQLIASIEAEIGYRLPDAYIALSRVRNGGLLARGAHPTAEPTGWASDHVAVTGIYAIGRTSRSCSTTASAAPSASRESSTSTRKPATG